MEAKIDDLSAKLSSRLEKAEGELTTLGIQVAQTRSNMEDLKEAAAERERKLPLMVENLIEKKMGTLSTSRSRQPNGKAPQPLGSSQALALEEDNE